MRTHLLRLLACAALLGLDALFARLCVAIDAAGALLSPSGAVSPEDLLAAGGFLLVRLTAIAALAGTGGLAVAAAVDRALRPWLPSSAATVARSRGGAEPDQGKR